MTALLRKWLAQCERDTETREDGNDRGLLGRALDTPGKGATNGAVNALKDSGFFAGGPAGAGAMSAAAAAAIGHHAGVPYGGVNAHAPASPLGVKGLVLDLEHGDLLRLDCRGRVRKALHGAGAWLDAAARRARYGDGAYAGFAALVAGEKSKRFSSLLISRPALRGSTSSLRLEMITGKGSSWNPTRSS